MNNQASFLDVSSFTMEEEVNQEIFEEDISEERKS